MTGRADFEPFPCPRATGLTMQNSVAKYRLAPTEREPRTPAPRAIGRGFGHRVDGCWPGLWCRLWVLRHPDSLTVKKFTVSAFVKGQVSDSAGKCATFDSLTENRRIASYVRPRRRAHMSVGVCHVVKSSVIHIQTYKSITYHYDSALTVSGPALPAVKGQGLRWHSLSGVGGLMRGILGRRWRG